MNYNTHSHWTLLTASLLCGVSSAYAAGIDTVSILGVTNTQVVFAYFAPDKAACRVEVSESPSYLPLVHDIDPALFTGSDLDDRAGSLSAGRTRIFVVGTRTIARARDGNDYSRALRARAAHYYRITCGTAVTTGQFMTLNIPLGMTYMDTPQVDPNNPGTYLTPSIPTARAPGIIDPFTGAFVQRATLAGETTSNPFLNYGGASRMCGDQLVGPGPGYLCGFANSTLYYIIPSTGEVRFLGVVALNRLTNADLRQTYVVSSPAPNSINPLNVYTTVQDVFGRTHLVRGTYTGSFAEVAPKSFASFTWESLTPSRSPAELVAAFDPKFDPSLYVCGFSVVDNYGLATCRRGIQDTYGWFAVFEIGAYPSDSPACAADSSQCTRVIAATDFLRNPATRWCSIHGPLLASGAPLVNITPQILSSPTVMGGGPYYTVLSATVTSADTTLTLTGGLRSGNTNPADSVPMQPAVGDVFMIEDGGSREFVSITAINSPTSWRVTRGYGYDGYYPAKPHASGARLSAYCKAWTDRGFPFWKFLQDPHGISYVMDQYFHMDHAEFTPNYRLTSGYQVVAGPIMDHLNEPLSFFLDSSPMFAGARGFGYGNSYATHPSMHQSQAPPSEQNWFLDMRPFNGSLSAVPGATLISGQLYKYIFDQWGARLHRKQLDTLALSGSNALVDVSGPNSLLSDSPADAYKYCVAYKAGECRPGSIPGDTYANVPNVQYLYCYGADHPPRGITDICIGDQGTYLGMAQLGLLPNGVGEPNGVIAGTPPLFGAGYSRVLTQGLTAPRDMFGFATAKALPDASWILFTVGSDTAAVMMLRNLPFEAPSDGLDRSTFIRARLNLTPPAAAGIASAVVQFGYAEKGPTDAYYCTSRRESCIAVGVAVDDADPFKYERSDTYTPTPCASACAITVPVLPMHVAYYRVKYLGSSGQVVATEAGVIAETRPASIIGGGRADATPPTVSIAAPARGATVSGTVTVSAAASDNVAVSGVQFLLNGFPLGNEVVSAPFSVSWDTAALSNGSYTLTARARDTAGNQATSAAVTVMVNNTPAIDLTYLGLAQSTLTGGKRSGGNFVLLGKPAPAGGAIITLTSSLPSVASVPATIIVAAGATQGTFTITSISVTASTPVTISAASGGGNPRTAALTVVPPALSYIGLAATTKTGGSTMGGNFILLTGPAPATGVVVSLASSLPAVASVPATVTVPAGATQAAFSVTTTAVRTATSAKISASSKGVAKSTTLTLVPPTLFYIGLPYASKTGGLTISGNFVLLTGPAPAGGITVSLTSSARAATVPASVTVPAGANSAGFLIGTGPVSVSTSVTISASYAQEVKTAIVTLLPPSQ